MAQSRELKPRGTLAQRLQAAEDKLIGSGRWLDLRLDLAMYRETDDRRGVAIPTGQPLLTAGGRWDRTFGRFLEPSTEGDAEIFSLVGVEESQREFVSFFAEWLSDYVHHVARDTTVAMLAGDRRGGKSFSAVAAVIAACVDCPTAADGTPLTAWLVCKSFRERFETEQWILNRIPSEWYHHLGAPVHEFHFAHGSILRLISVDDEQATKQGRVDIAYLNEPQKMGPQAVANAVLGSSDLGGLVILAANPPGDDGRGEWMFDLKEALDDERVALAKGQKVEPLGVRFFHFDSKKNRSIDQVSRRRAGRIAGLINPKNKAGDVEGEWRRPIDRAAWEFDKHRHLHTAPQIGVRDITQQLLADHDGNGCVAAAGIDFQNRPHIVCAVARCYGDPDDPIIAFVGEHVGERRQSEEQFLETFEEYAKPKGWTRESLLWIGDASSSWQGPRHDFEHEERDSFSVFREAGWEIVPSREPAPNSKTGRGRNPDIADRLQLINERLRRDRVLIDPNACPWIAECFAKAQTKREDGKRKLKGDRYAHGFDAATYLIHRICSTLGGGDRGGSASDARFVRPRRPASW